MDDAGGSRFDEKAASPGGETAWGSRVEDRLSC
jgi:hypothetical protein